MVNSHEVTVTLGDEFDDELRHRLLEVLNSLGAVSSEGERLIAGSQEIESYTVAIQDDEVRIEAKTYMGLTISGPMFIIAKIQQMLGEKSKKET